MIILGIESSCDETAAAVVEDGKRLLSNVVHSQIDIHSEYGGVVPEVAARSHLEVINPVINRALADAGCGWEDIDAIAVTYAPGLIGSLLVGSLAARTLAIIHDKPLYKIHHVEAHVYANFITSQSSQASSSTLPTHPPRSTLFSSSATGTELERSAEISLESISQSPRGSVGSGGEHTTPLSAVPQSSPISIRSTETSAQARVSDEGVSLRTEDCLSKASPAGSKENTEEETRSAEAVEGERDGEKARSKNEVPALRLPHTQPSFPLLALIVSGGHSQLVFFRTHGDYDLIGQTQDDAVGEAFDKVAKILGLPYPGGPSISKAAEQGDPHAFKLPIAKLQGKYDFSFSGLKTAVLRAVQREVGKDFTFPSHALPALVGDELRHNTAASFQYTAIKTLVDKTIAAFRNLSPASVVIAGGVAANQELRRQLSAALPITIEYAPIQLCTDNAAMIAALAYYRSQIDQPADPLDMEVRPSLSMLSYLQQGTEVV